MRWLFCFVRAFRHVIPLLWAAAAGWGLQVTLNKNGFIDNLADNMDSPVTSPSNVSARLFERGGFGYADSGVAFSSAGAGFATAAASSAAITKVLILPV